MSDGGSCRSSPPSFPPGSLASMSFFLSVSIDLCVQACAFCRVNTPAESLERSGLSPVVDTLSFEQFLRSVVMKDTFVCSEQLQCLGKSRGWVPLVPLSACYPRFLWLLPKSIIFEEISRGYMASVWVGVGG